VQLSAEGEWLSLQVSDNGKGISPEMLINTHSLGVVGMRERTRIAGGELIIGRCTTGRWTEGAGPGCGTSVVARFPLRLHEAAESTGSDPVKLEPVKSS
jgi:signal transduction histidine kinase